MPTIQSYELEPDYQDHAVDVTSTGDRTDKNGDCSTNSIGDRHYAVGETTCDIKLEPVGVPKPARRHSKKRHHSGMTCADGCIDTMSRSSNSDSVDIVTKSSSSTDDKTSWRLKTCCHMSDKALVGLLAVIGLLGIAIPTSLGVYALIVVEPSPVIDKSVAAFEIPNHKASRRYDALQKAMEEMRGYLHLIARSGRRKKRDVRSDTAPITLTEDSLLSARGSENPWRSSSLFEESEGLISHRSRSQRYKRDLYEAGYRVPYYTQGSRQWKLQLYYVARGEEPLNIFTRERLEDIHKIERGIMEIPGYEKYCYIDYRLWDAHEHFDKYHGCAPLNTLLTYFYPTVYGDQDNGTVYFDSFGDVLYENINDTLDLAMTDSSFFWYVDDKITKNNKKSRLLRSEAFFGKPLEGYSNFGDKQSQREQKDRYVKFITSYIDVLEKASTKNVTVLYGGTELFDYMVDKIFWNDLMLTFFAAGFIVILMYVLTAFSVWLTIWGMLTIVLSFPLALFFYRVVFGTNLLGILNGVATFVVIGIGVDDVFVFINTFRQIDQEMSLASRIRFTVVLAGKATFFTSATTAAAFAANIASSIPAVHDFGLFMSIIVISCWIMVMWLMPPALIIWQLAFAPCESCCYRSCRQCGGMRSVSVPSELGVMSKSTIHPGVGTAGSVDPVRAWAESHAGIASGPDVVVDDCGHGLSGDKDWAPDLEVCPDGGWPTYLGTLSEIVHKKADDLDNMDNKSSDDVKSPKPRTEVSGCDMIRHMQIFTYKYIAKPVIRARYIVIGLYVAILLVSAGLTSQLVPATKPPQLFAADTNLQMLVDLAANFSNEDIDCDRCSGVYVTGPGTLNRTKTEIPRGITPPFNLPGAGPSPAPSMGPTDMPNVPKTTSPVPVPRPTNPEPTPDTTPPSIAPTPAGPDPTPAMPTTTPKTTAPTPNPLPAPAPVPQPPPTPTVTVPTDPPTTASPTPPPTIGSTTARTTNQPSAVPSLSPMPTATSTQPSELLSTEPPDSSQAPNLGVCDNNRCEGTVQRPNLQDRAIVYVVFGISGFHRGNSSASVLTDSDDDVLSYDEKFDRDFSLTNLLNDTAPLKELCTVCKMIAINSDFVLPNGAQCFPEYIFAGRSPNGLDVRRLIRSVPECKGVPVNQKYRGSYLPSRSIIGYTAPNPNQPDVGLGFKWITFSFASTTFKGQSYFSAYEDYQRWESLIQKIKSEVLAPDSALHSMFQTSEFWTQVLMEVVAVNSAIYGLVFSLLICVSLVAIFTGHVLLLLIVLLTILGVVLLVVALFYLAGWELGAVEAVSLSILVGSSVDYCAHLVEGYLQAGSYVPVTCQGTAAKARHWRARSAVSHIGVSIISSALTTIIAAVPLTQTVIIPFSKFGQIVAINTTVSIVYTLTACTALLALFAPAYYKRTVRSVGIAFGSTVAVIATLVLVLFGVSQLGYHIPGPSGEDLFPVPT